MSVAKSSSRMLTALFLSAIDEETRRAISIDVSVLEGTLREALSAARERFSTIALSDEVFVPFLAARLGRQLASGRLSPQVAELYLCCACLRRDPRALAAFEAQYLPAMRRALSRVRLDAAAAEELLQGLRLRLFADDRKGPPKLAEFRGAGSLVNWLRVVVVHAALNSRRQGRLTSARELPLYDASSELPLSTLASDSDPELDHLRAHYAGTLREALAAALAELCEADRALLRLSILNGLPCDALGRLLHVHRATAARRVAAAREELLRSTKRHLAARARLRDGEVSSVLRALVHDLEVSISELLGEQVASKKLP